MYIYLVVSSAGQRLKAGLETERIALDERKFKKLRSENHFAKR